MGKYYIGNFPNSANYDPNIPIGSNRWDAMECNDEMDNGWDEEYDADEEEDEVPEKNIPDEDKEKELLKKR